MELVLGQLWNLVVMLLVLSIVIVGLTTMVGKGKWGMNTVCAAWKWLFLAPFRILKWIGKGFWKMLFPKKKSAGRSGRRGGTRTATT